MGSAGPAENSVLISVTFWGGKWRSEVGSALNWAALISAMCPLAVSEG